MKEAPETTPPERDLGEWERALTINVGTVYVCRACSNFAMVTKGGLGTLDMICCGKPMEKLKCRPQSDGGLQ